MTLKPFGWKMKRPDRFLEMFISLQGSRVLIRVETVNHCNMCMSVPSLHVMSCHVMSLSSRSAKSGLNATEREFIGRLMIPVRRRCVTCQVSMYIDQNPMSFRLLPTPRTPPGPEGPPPPPPMPAIIASRSGAPDRPPFLPLTSDRSRD